MTVTSIHRRDDAARALQFGIVEKLRADLTQTVKPPRKRKKPKRMPRAAKAIAWGKPDRDSAEGVFASLERMTPGFASRRPLPWGSIILAWATIVILLAAGLFYSATHRAGGSDGRTDLQNLDVR